MDVGRTVVGARKATGSVATLVVVVSPAKGNRNGRTIDVVTVAGEVTGPSGGCSGWPSTSPRSLGSGSTGGNVTTVQPGTTVDVVCSLPTSSCGCAGGLVVATGGLVVDVVMPPGIVGATAVVLVVAGVLVVVAEVGVWARTPVAPMTVHTAVTSTAKPRVSRDSAVVHIPKPPAYRRGSRSGGRITP
ncbi:MAG: hypothetical protein ACLGI2_10045 [Acidimicrobiia bacterium]